MTTLLTKSGTHRSGQEAEPIQFRSGGESPIIKGPLVTVGVLRLRNELFVKVSSCDFPVVCATTFQQFGHSSPVAACAPPWRRSEHAHWIGTTIETART